MTITNQIFSNTKWNCNFLFLDIANEKHNKSYLVLFVFM